MTDMLTQALHDPMRLQTLRALAIFDTPAEMAFDRLTRLASRIVGAPVALVSLVDDHRQWFKSMVGLPEPWATQRETPLSHSFCQHVMATNQPLVVSDAREVSFLKDNLAIPDLNVIAYLGMPLTTRDGFGLGSFCIIDGHPREWTQDEIEIMRDLADTTMALIDMRGQLISLHYLSQEKIDTIQRNLDQQVRIHQQTLAEFQSMLERNASPQSMMNYVQSLPRALN